MYLHANAKLGLAGRSALVTAIESGMTLKATAAAFNVSPATVHRWWHRWREAGEEARRTRSCLLDRSSLPTARLAGLRRSSRRRSAGVDDRPVGVRGWSRGPPASRTRPCGRCCGGRGSRGLAYRSHRQRNRRCHTGSTTTTGKGRTARSEAGLRSAAFTTSVGRTAIQCQPRARPCHASRGPRLARTPPRPP
jgi:hypothetical protein